MKAIRILFLIVLPFLINVATSGQVMDKLYTYLINDYYKELCNKGYLSKQDVLYFTCGLCSDCQGKCFDYKVELKTDKIQFKLPTVDKEHPKASFYNLSLPELKKQFIIIDIGIYSMIYNADNGRKIIYCGTRQYIFKYDKRVSKYVFSTKKEYGI